MRAGELGLHPGLLYLVDILSCDLLKSFFSSKLPGDEGDL